MIEAKGVCLKYLDGTNALENIDLHIRPGEVVYITGPSGSGKTSLLKLFMGVEYPTLGSLSVMGQTMRKEEALNIRRLRKKLGPIFQEFRLIKGRTSLENVKMGIQFLGLPTKQINDNASDALKRVGLGHKANSIVDNLSWGEGQRVSIARAVARKPSLILADEPTGNLDKENALKILGLLNSLKDENTTVIITTHATHLIEDMEEGLLIRVERGNILCERLGTT